MTQIPSSNRLDRRFDVLRAENSAALVLFVTAGDPRPDVEYTAQLVVRLAEAGADVIELGIPYSDPQADGPSVQAASQRSLEGGVNTKFVFEAVRIARRATDTPIVLMTYYNPVLRFGLSRFAREASDAGADGVILTDLPPEEADPWLQEAERAGLATIFLLAPTSTAARVQSVVSKMRGGFVYCVSRTGVTGARRELPVELSEMIDRVRAETSLPACVGFGITTPEHVSRISSIADGAVIGSALVDFLHEHVDSPDLGDQLTEMVAGWKRATHRNRAGSS